VEEWGPRSNLEGSDPAEDAEFIDKAEQIKEALIVAFYFAITHHDGEMTSRIVNYAHHHEKISVEDLTKFYQAAFDATFKEKEK
jgi:hypothetical protein